MNHTKLLQFNYDSVVLFKPIVGILSDNKNRHGGHGVT